MHQSVAQRVISVMYVFPQQGAVASHAGSWVKVIIKGGCTGGVTTRVSSYLIDGSADGLSLRCV